MEKSNSQMPNYPNSTHITCLSWKSILAGLAVSILSFMILMILGVAIGGIALSDLEGFSAFSWSAGAWAVLTGMISLFAGAYSASRVSNFISAQVGVVQALSISALFFAFLFWAGGSFLGSMGGVIASATGTLMNPVGKSPQLLQRIAENEEVIAATRNQLAQLGIRPSEVDQLAVGVISRWMSEGANAAKNYISRETNLEPGELEASVNEIGSAIAARAETLASETAKAFSAAGWFLFLLLALSSALAILGGVLGSRQNAKKSIEAKEWLGTHQAA